MTILETLSEIEAKAKSKIHYRDQYSSHYPGEWGVQLAPESALALVSALRVAREALEITHESCEWCTDRAGKALTHINELFEKEGK